MPKKIPVCVYARDSQLDFNLKPSLTGGQLLTQVCNTLGIREIWYFGLQYTCDKGQKRWMKQSKYINTIKSKEMPLVFYFRVKFYPEEVSEDLIEDVTRLYFYYDVKESIVSGEVYCSGDNGLLLASYQAYIRHGKYDPSVHTPGFLKIEKYLSTSIRDQFHCSDEEWEAKIVKCYKEYKDLTKEDAILEYLKIAQDLEMFGVSYFKIKNARQTELWLGVDALGLNIYELENQLSPKVNFPWSEIRRLSFIRNKFSVKPVDPSGKPITFYTDNVRTCKDILRISTGNHDLFAMRRQPDTVDVQQMKVKAKEQKSAREAERQRLRAAVQAQETMEKRLRDMERTFHENEESHARTQAALEQYELRISELHAQLEEEKRARQHLEELQRHLEEMNRRLELETAQSLEERQRMSAERDAIFHQISEQSRLLKQKEEEKIRYESELARIKAEQEAKLSQLNGARKDADECELQIVREYEEDVRQAKAETDLDHAQKLKMLRQDLDALRDKQKMQPIDVIHEENVSKGVDKYRTLRAIREGNTKKRVDQFESM